MLELFDQIIGSLSKEDFKARMKSSEGFDWVTEVQTRTPISSQFENFLRNCLEYDPSKRKSAKQLLEVHNCYSNHRTLLSRAQRSLLSHMKNKSWTPD